MLALALAAVLAVDPALDAKGSPPGKPDAEALLVQGKRHFVRREYAKAVEKFQAAYELDGRTIHLYNIGKCHDRLKAGGTALRYYREYLRLEPKAQEDETVKGDIANAVRHLRELGRQQVVVFTEPWDAEVLVDQERQPRTATLPGQATAPVYVELTDGPHLFVVSAGGHQTEERHLRLPLPAGAAEQTFNLLPARPAADTPVAPTAASLVPAEPSDSPTEVLVKEAPRRPLGAGVGTWVSGAVAVAGGGAGLGLGLAFSNVDKERHTMDADRTTSQANALEARAHALEAGTFVAVGVAGAAVVTAIVLYFVERR